MHQVGGTRVQVYVLGNGGGLTLLALSALGIFVLAEATAAPI